MFFHKSPTMVSPQDALPGRSERPFRIAPDHVVLGTPIEGAVAPGHEEIFFAMGCFWGVRAHLLGDPRRRTRPPSATWAATRRTPRTRRRAPAAPATPRPSGSSTTPRRSSLETLLKAFWENHDPTTPNRQGNDIGTQYRSAIYPTTDAQLAAAARLPDALPAGAQGGRLRRDLDRDPPGRRGAGTFWYAEDYHQGYLHKNPRGYCNHGFCQVAYDPAAHGQDAPTKVALPEA